MKNLLSIILMLILCTTILLGMSNFVSAATTGNSLPDFIDFGTGYSLADNWEYGDYATIVDGQMRITSTARISRGYTPVTSGKVIYSFDYDTTGMNTTNYIFPIQIHLGDASKWNAAGIYIRGTYVDNITPNTKILNPTVAFGKYSMKVIVNLDATPKTYDVYIYNQSKTQIGSLLNQTYSTTSFDKITFSNYTTNTNYLLVDNISVNRYTALTNPTPSIADQTQNVSIETTTLTYTFNNPIDATTLSGISISPTVIGSTYALDPQDEKTVIYTFPQGLKAAKTYTVTIPTTVKDIANQSLSSTYTSSFTTSVPQDVLFLGTPSFTNLAGDTISTLSAGSSFVVDVPITNNSSVSKTVYLIATLCEGTTTDYTVTNMSFMKKTLESGEASDFGAGFNLPSNTASSFVKIYAWDKLIGGTPLAEVIMFP